jgi:hypothetical protein
MISHQYIKFTTICGHFGKSQSNTQSHLHLMSNVSTVKLTRYQNERKSNEKKGRKKQTFSSEIREYEKMSKRKKIR